MRRNHPRPDQRRAAHDRCRSARARHAPSAGPRYRNDRSEITATRRL